ncbi:DUF2306 domain-containing protein [Ensifer canadensis]
MTLQVSRASALATSGRNRVGWWLVCLAAIGTALYSAAPYLTFNPALSRIPLNPDFAFHLLWISVHGAPSAIALLLGPFQFLSGFRKRYPRYHRISGRIYLLSVLVGSVTGFVAAVTSTSGVPAQVGFVLLVAAWLYSGWRAYRAARHGLFSDHRVWMVRNYSLTFASVLLRAFIVIGLGFQTLSPALTFGEIYTAAVWSSILISYLFAEWFILSPEKSR